MVLNETAELLGLSLRMTEDQLTRDMLAATAGFYNCTGGVNGDLKRCEVVKSSLIDSKFLPGRAGDNEAEAGLSCTVNAVSEKNAVMRMQYSELYGNIER